MRTQWRTGSMGAALGLDYGPLFRRLDQLCESRDEWERRYAEIRYMEAAAIEQMADDSEGKA